MTAPSTVFLHVGLHKTGTTYLQNLLRANTDALARQGLYYPDLAGHVGHALAAWDLHGLRPAGAVDKRIAGSWSLTANAVNSCGLPRALVSAERLSVSTPRQAKRAVQSFPSSDVRVIVTARDLGRVLVSSWQEKVKGGKTWTWREFADAVQDPEAYAVEPARSFWLEHDLLRVCETWEAVVSADKVTVVTVPRPGSSPDELLARFSGLIGIDPASLTETPAWTNESVGVAGTEVIRRLNTELTGSLNQRQQTHLVKGGLAQALARGTTLSRFRLPDEEFGWVSKRADQLVDDVAARGYDIVGDLDELRVTSVGTGRRPDSATDEELLEAAFVALGWLARRHAKLWWRHRKEDEVVPGSGGLGSRTRAVAFRAKQWGATLADRNRVAAKAMGAVLISRDRARARMLKRR
jgi:hypothetical protein